MLDCKEIEFIPYSLNTGKFNMDFDEILLNRAIQEATLKPILRLYGWSPACVSLGRNQNENSVNTDYCKANNIDIVKRLTGGRALLHDKELTYSFVCHKDFLKNGDSVTGSYKEISGALVEGFRLLGIDLEFPIDKKVDSKPEYCMSISTGADLSYRGKKLVGSAQFRKENYILQHGSILFSYDAEKIKNIFGETPDSSKITTLNEINPEIDFEQLCESIKSGFEVLMKN